MVAAATVSRDELTLASIGSSLDADFDIGSISKGITGLLYADGLSYRDLLRERITDPLELGARRSLPPALDPVTNFYGPAARIGAGWMTLTVRDRAITWHNGGTGGFRSWIGLDREAQTGVVVMSATSASVDRHGFAMLEDLTARSATR